MAERILLPVHEVQRRTGLSRSQLYNFVRSNKFPQGFNLAGTRRVVFDSLAVQNWIDEQAATAGKGLKK